MILVRLFGGLGNQMFQYACARRLAQAQGAGLKLDLTAFERYGPRRYALGGLHLSAEVADTGELKAFQRRARLSGRLPRWLRHKVPGWRYELFRERGFAFDPAVLELRGNILLEGYWQSERYFHDIAGIVRREFRSKEALSANGTSLATRIAGANAVSVHLRRGDYVSSPHASRVHGVCDLDYYRRAAEIVARTVPRPEFFLFSDDPAWAGQNLRLGFPTVLVAGEGDAGAREDLQLMSLCRHHIIANSSFSWWGAWLDPKPEKTVIAPRRWFNEDSRDTRDLIPAGWTQI